VGVAVWLTVGVADGVNEGVAVGPGVVGTTVGDGLAVGGGVVLMPIV